MNYLKIDFDRIDVYEELKLMKQVHEKSVIFITIGIYLK